MYKWNAVHWHPWFRLKSNIKEFHNFHRLGRAKFSIQIQNKWKKIYWAYLCHRFDEKCFQYFLSCVLSVFRNRKITHGDQIWSFSGKRASMELLMVSIHCNFCANGVWCTSFYNVFQKYTWCVFLLRTKIKIPWVPVFWYRHFLPVDFLQQNPTYIFSYQKWSENDSLRRLIPINSLSDNSTRNLNVF